MPSWIQIGKLFLIKPCISCMPFSVSGISNAALPVSDTTTVGLDEETDTEAGVLINQ